jgi:hypothetical protein
LRANKDVKGGSRTKLMVGAMIITGLLFLPATPIFLLTPGHSSTVVKSTEITAQIDGATSILEAGLRRTPENSTALREMMDNLPPRVFSGEGREGDMVSLVFVGQQKDLQEAFQRAGWVRTDRLRPAFVWHLLRYGTSDTKLPMSRFYHSEEHRTTRMPYPIRMEWSHDAIIFVSGKPILRLMAPPSGRAPPPTTSRLKSRSEDT